MMSPNNCTVTSKIYGLQIAITKIIMMKILYYCENYQNVPLRQEVSKCSWKNGAHGLA